MINERIAGLEAEVEHLKALVWALVGHFKLSSHSLLAKEEQGRQAAMAKQAAVKDRMLAFEEESLARMTEYKKDRGIAESFMLKGEEALRASIERRRAA